MDNENMDRIMGIGPEHKFSDDIVKRLRVGTIKQLREVSELTNDGLLRPRAAANSQDEEIRKTQADKWVEVLNMITIEGFTREEFEESMPDLVEDALNRFQFGQ